MSCSKASSCSGSPSLSTYLPLQLQAQVPVLVVKYGAPSLQPQGGQPLLDLALPAHIHRSSSADTSAAARSSTPASWPYWAHTAARLSRTRLSYRRRAISRSSSWLALSKKERKWAQRSAK